MLHAAQDPDSQVFIKEALFPYILCNYIAEPISQAQQGLAVQKEPRQSCGGQDHHGLQPQHTRSLQAGNPRASASKESTAYAPLVGCEGSGSHRFEKLPTHRPFTAHKRGLLTSPESRLGQDVLRPQPCENHSAIFNEKLHRRPTNPNTGSFLKQLNHLFDVKKKRSDKKEKEAPHVTSQSSSTKQTAL